MTPTYWLSCHVGYACRDSGACCRAGWPLPVESRVVAPITAAVAAGRLSTVDGGVVWLRETAEAPDGMAGTLRLADGGCAFHVPAQRHLATPGAGRHCAVHAALGHEALPVSCQHFPRVCLIDSRGVRVALSHFCPTAAAMLVDDGRPVTIVTGPPAVPGVDVPEGLDVRDALPPRLNERVLMDLDALTAWEAHVVAALAGPDAASGPVETTLAALAAQAEQLARWSPGEGPLVDAVRAVAVVHQPAAPSSLGWTAEAVADVMCVACRPPWTWPELPPDLATLEAALVAPQWAAVAPVVRRYLAGKAFGAWITYQADGVRGLVGWLGLAAAVLRFECVRACQPGRQMLDRDRLVTALRQADLALVHYADSLEMARRVPLANAQYHRPGRTPGGGHR